MRTPVTRPIRSMVSFSRQQIPLKISGYVMYGFLEVGQASDSRRNSVFGLRTQQYEVKKKLPLSGTFKHDGVVCASFFSQRFTRCGVDGAM